MARMTPPLPALDDISFAAVVGSAAMRAFGRLVDHGEIIAFDRNASARSKDHVGRMHVAGCRISKANVCPYYGREIPGFKHLGLDPNKIYKLYRDPEELKKAAPSFRNLQLLMLHTKVTAQNPKNEITVGTVGSEISFDGKYLVADQLTVWDGEGISLIESEAAKELSSSYHYRADMTPGVTPEGVAYDGVMRDIMGNHVALVPEGRAGSDVVVNDALPSEFHTMKRPHLLARLIGLGVVVAPTTDEERVALDAKLEAMTAKDAVMLEEDEEDDPENPGKKRKKMNPGKGKAGEPGGALANDEALATAIDAAIKSRGYVSKDEAQGMANDAAARASADAVERVNALHNAREAVKPLVGVVAMDSAEAVYKFALEHEKVALDGVPSAAYPALVRERVAAKAAAAASPRAVPTIAADAANAAAAALPGLGRFQVA